MKRSSRVPLAWKNLTHNYRRLLTAVAGITFAVVLMFVERGFQHALFDSTIYVIRDLKADLVIRSNAKYLFESPHRFDVRRLIQAKAHPQVETAYPVYVEVGGSNLKRIGYPSYPIRVLAFDVEKDLCRIPGVQGNALKLRSPMTAIIDSKSKQKEYHLPLDHPDELAPIPTELARKQVHLVGTFSLGTDFANDGTLIMTTKNFARFFAYRGRGRDPLSHVDLGLVHLKEHADPQQVCQELNSQLPRDVLIETKSYYMQREMDYWANSTPVGFIFLLGVVLGFIVGIVICYQIIFSNINDHQAEFATLKAMGYSTRYFIGIVLGKSVYLSILGFLPGLLISEVIFQVLSRWTGLLMELTTSRVLSIYVLTLAMCVSSGCIAIRRILALEPADLF